MSKIVDLVTRPRKPKWLFTVGVYEESDGTEVAVLEDMPVSGIREDLSPANRTRALAKQLHRAASIMFDRAALIDDPPEAPSPASGDGNSVTPLGTG